MHRVFSCPAVIRAIPILLLSLSFLAAESFGESKSPDLDAARERIEFLRSEIARHDDLYYRKAAPEISDQAYDALKSELQNLERTYPEVVDALGERDRLLGDDRSGDLPTALHSESMLSLAKAYSEEELEAFCVRWEERFRDERAKLLLEPKIDGMAISLVYEQGKLARAVTRGDGKEGDVITENVRIIEGVPSELNLATKETAPEMIELRGEIFVSLKNFEEINRERTVAGVEAYAHPRNYAAASAKMGDVEAVSERRLSVVIFGYGEFVPSAGEPSSLSAFYQKVRDWGLPVVPNREIGLDWEAARKASREAILTDWGGDSGYPTDGFVFKLDNLRQRNVLGTGSEAPRWAIAYKPVSAQAATLVTDIQIQVSRTGRMVPVAAMEPVEVGGSEISRATLHNRGWIADRDVRIGDKVIVARVGDVIPAIVKVDKSARGEGSMPFLFPTQCPDCTSVVIEENGEVYCDNANCPAVLIGRLEHFASSKAAGIRGLGPATIEKWVSAGFVASIADLYRLDAATFLSEDDTLSVREKRILTQIESSKGADWRRIIYGLGLPGVGPVRAEELARIVDDISGLQVLGIDQVSAREQLRELEWSDAAKERLLSHLSKESVQRDLQELATFGVGP